MISILANRQSYTQLTKEGGHMYEVLHDLLKDEFDIAEERGEIKGTIRVYHDELGLSVSEITAKIMVKYDLKKKEAEKIIEETLGLQPA